MLQGGTNGRGKRKCAYLQRSKISQMLRLLGSNKSSGMIFMGRIKQGVNIEIKAACG
jgi:hypothetical protein